MEQGIRDEVVDVTDWCRRSELQAGVIDSKNEDFMRTRMNYKGDVGKASVGAQRNTS
jgi:hypothetical protein